MTRLSLRPGPRSGLEIADARGWRIDATSGGGIVQRTPDGTETAVAAPGQVARVVLLRGEHVPKRLRVTSRHGFFEDYDEALAVLSDDAALLVVPVRLLSSGDVRSATEMRQVAGVDDFAQALGLALEPGTDADAALAADPSVHAQGPVRTALRPVFWRHVVLLPVATIALIAVINASGDAGRIAAIVGTVALVILAVDQWRHRSRFLELVTRRPSDAARVEVPSALGPGHPRGAREAILQIGPDDVFHAASGTETWVAGPRRGGVKRCLVSDDLLVFVDRRDAALLTLGVTSWIPDGDTSALERACRTAGIEVKRARGEFAYTDEPDAVLARTRFGPAYSPFMTQSALGDFVMLGPLATSLVAFVMAMGHLVPFDDLDVARASIAAAAAAACVISAAAQLRLRRWERGQTRTE